MENLKLKKYNQMHVLKFEDKLDKEEKENLYSQIDELDFSYLDALNKKEEAKKFEITPIKTLSLNEIKENEIKFNQIGLNALRNNEVGVLLLAGGMGTRLGSNEPKGMYNIGKTKDVFIFQRIFENLLDVVKISGKYIPLFIMTSEKNNDATVNFIKDHDYFGYDKNYVKFFVQEMSVCVDFNGKLLLEEKGKIATSPNGNGGWFNSLLKNQEAKSMLEKFNLKYINVFAVDNVLQKIADPVFIGALIDKNYELGAKAIRKTNPYEKVGVFCKKNGRPSIVEYIDVTEEMANEKDSNGEYVYNFDYLLPLA